MLLLQRLPGVLHRPVQLQQQLWRVLHLRRQLPPVARLELLHRVGLWLRPLNVEWANLSGEWPEPLAAALAAAAAFASAAALASAFAFATFSPKGE